MMYRILFFLVFSVQLGFGMGLVPVPSTTSTTTTTIPDNTEAERSYGFGASTLGGLGGTVIVVTTPTEAAVRTALTKASVGHAIVRFEVSTPISIKAPLPQLKGAFITIDGNGATLIGDNFPNPGALLQVRGHDVIVKNLRLRNAGDNLSAQGDGAKNIVFRHISSTGAADDGISIGYGAQNVTVQNCFLAGNTRSIFMKYGSTTNVSIHHTWIQKQWIRGPLVSQAVFADIRNVIVEDWTEWGVRFENTASGNVVQSLFILSPYAKSQGGKVNSALRLEQTTGDVFTQGNYYVGTNQGGTGNVQAGLPVPFVPTQEIMTTQDQVRAQAGCLPRDAVDQAYIDRKKDWDVTESTPLRLP